MEFSGEWETEPRSSLIPSRNQETIVGGQIMSQLYLEKGSFAFEMS